jgi:hypothetical protein
VYLQGMFGIEKESIKTWSCSLAEFTAQQTVEQDYFVLK